MFIHGENFSVLPVVKRVRISSRFKPSMHFWTTNVWAGLHLLDLNFTGKLPRFLPAISVLMPGVYLGSAQVAARCPGSIQTSSIPR